MACNCCRLCFDHIAKYSLIMDDAGIMTDAAAPVSYSFITMRESFNRTGKLGQRFLGMVLQRK